jgi:glutathionylspermidine synthase
MSAAIELVSSASPRAGRSIPPEAFELVRRRTLLEGCKWDAQVGDVATLAEFPLLLERATWLELADAAERLTAETFAAEDELLARPDLLARIGLPGRIRRALAAPGPVSRVAARSLRFDLHWTTEGWRLSEVNSDVPGGFAEASLFTRLLAAHVQDFVPAGSPVDDWADAIARAAGSRRPIALLAAPGFMEDHQILIYLARQLAVRGCEARLASPRQLEWRRGEGYLVSGSSSLPLGAIVRFYQGEWLAGFRARHWAPLFRGGRTPVANPGLAAISESKRFPLVWDSLHTPLPTWRAFLPETREPCDAPWRRDTAWLVKSALSNTGDSVSMRDLMSEADWRRVQWEVRLRPGAWAAQRRFESVPIETPRGSMHACVGIYTIDGKAAGAYARLSPKPLIDFASIDCALLVAEAR